MTTQTVISGIGSIVGSNFPDMIRCLEDDVVDMIPCLEEEEEEDITRQVIMPGFVLVRVVEIQGRPSCGVCMRRVRLHANLLHNTAVDHVPNPGGRSP